MGRRLQKGTKAGVKPWYTHTHTHRGTKKPKPKPKQTQLVSDIIVHKQTLTAQDPHVEPGVDVGQLILENKLYLNFNLF